MTWIWALTAIAIIVIVIVLCLIVSYVNKDETYIQETKEYIQNFKLDSIKLESIKINDIDVEKANKLVEKVSSKVKDKGAVKVTTLGLETLEGKLVKVNTVENIFDISYVASLGGGFITENKPDTELDFNLLKDILGEQPKQLLFKKDWSLVDISYINEEANQKLEEKKKELLSKFSDMTKDKATALRKELNDYAPVCITKHEICYYHKPTHLLIKINYEI